MSILSDRTTNLTKLGPATWRIKVQFLFDINADYLKTKYCQMFIELSGGSDNPTNGL